jgi:hypothetical protein
VVNNKIVFRKVTPYSLVDRYQHVIRTCCLHLQGSWHHIPEDCNLTSYHVIIGIIVIIIIIISINIVSSSSCNVIVKLIFVLFFMIPGNNDELTQFVACVALCGSQLRVGVL